MAAASTPLVEQAQSIFSQLGYTVSGDGPEFRAEREWKMVHVSAVDEIEDTPESGTYRCFVTYRDLAPELRRRIQNANPEYEWALISVGENDEYDVVRAPS